MDLVNPRGSLAAQRLRMATARTSLTTTATERGKRARSAPRGAAACPGGTALDLSLVSAWLYHGGSVVRCPSVCVAPDRPHLSGSSVLVTACTLWLLFVIIFVQCLLCDLKARMGKATGLESVTLCILSY